MYEIRTPNGMVYAGQGFTGKPVWVYSSGAGSQWRHAPRAAVMLDYLRESGYMCEVLPVESQPREGGSLQV